MKKILSLTVLALMVLAVPAIVKAAENAKKTDEVVVSTVLEPAR